MAGFNIAASAPGFESTVRAMKAMPATVKREASRRSRTLAEPLAREIRAAGHQQGSQAARVADTVRAGAKAGVPSVSARGKPYTMGSEYGSHFTRRTTYYSTSPLGRRYLVVQRHTTRQFRPFRKSGYWFTQAAQHGRGRDAVLLSWAKLVDDIIQDF